MGDLGFRISVALGSGFVAIKKMAFQI